MEATTNSEQPCLSVLEPFTHSLEPYNSSNSSKPCLSILEVCMPSPLSIIPVTLWCMFLYTYFYFRDLFTTPQACNFIKKETLSQLISCEFCKISKNTNFTEHLWETASQGKSHPQEPWFQSVCTNFRIFFSF